MSYQLGLLSSSLSSEFFIHYHIYFSIAVTNHHDQDNLWKEVLIWSYSFRGLESKGMVAGAAENSHLNQQVGGEILGKCELLKPQSSSTVVHLFLQSHPPIPPQAAPRTGTKYSNIWAYCNHSYSDGHIHLFDFLVFVCSFDLGTKH